MSTLRPASASSSTPTQGSAFSSTSSSSSASPSISSSPASLTSNSIGSIDSSFSSTSSHISSSTGSPAGYTPSGSSGPQLELRSSSSSWSSSSPNDHHVTTPQTAAFPSSSPHTPTLSVPTLTSPLSASSSSFAPPVALSSSTWAPIIHPTSGDHKHIHNHQQHHHHHHQRTPFRPDRLATIDLIIVVVYICLLLSTSISTMIQVRRSQKKRAAAAGNKGQGGGYLSVRKMNWFTVGASIFASNLGSEHFIGLSGSAAANGIGVAAFEMNALIILQLASWIFLPVLIVSKISTLPEYMEKRFGGKRIRSYLAILSILLYIFTKISVNLYSGGIFIQQAIGWNLYTSAMFILALTSIMTLTGGVKGAMVIDNLQAFVMTTGASIVSAKALVVIGGWDGLKRRYMEAVPSKVPANLTRCAQPNPRAFQMLRPYNDPDMPWVGFILGQTTASIWYWCADQMMVQRFLSARSLAHVQGSAVFAGYLKCLSFLLMVIPGMISRCLFTDEVSCIDPDECLKYCQSSVSCSNTAYPRLVLELMPMGARGMLVAAMVAALMNDLCNVFNSASALFSCDIWPLFRSRASPKEQETVGRVFVFVLVLASIMWIPVIQEMQGGQLFIYIQAVSGLFAPPITAVYLCAVLWKRTNETGAFWSMMIGFALAIFRLVLSFMHKEPSCGQTVDERPWILKDVHYMYYSAFLFVATTSSALLISNCTRPPAPFRLIRTTFWTRFDTQIRRDDKNVFEMKYTGKTTTSNSREAITNSEDTQSSELALVSSQPTNASSTNTLLPAPSLFTIEEQEATSKPPKEAGPQLGDLSSVVINSDTKAAPGAPRRPLLAHQSSLSGAVGEAGKLLASRLASEGAKAKDIVLAAATHLKGKPPTSSQIRFQNLRADEEDEEDEDDEDEDADDERAKLAGAARRKHKGAFAKDNEEEEPESGTNLDGEDEDDEEQPRLALQRHKRTRRSGPQAAISAALSSYKLKQALKLKDGYQKAAAFDEDDDEDETGTDLEGAHRAANNSNPNQRLAQSASTSAGGLLLPGDESSTDDARATPTSGVGGTRRLLGNNSRPNGLDHTQRRNQQKVNKSKRQQEAASMSKKKKNSKKKPVDYEEQDDGDEVIDERRYKCIDNSVALLIKTRVEEYFLRISVGSIILFALGIFIIMSLPTPTPDKVILDMLKE